MFGTGSKWLRAAMAFLIVASLLAPLAAIGQQQTATLNVNSDPQGATIYLDRNPNPVGTTPATLTVSAGTHILILRKEGCRDALITVSVRAGETRNVSARLSCTSGKALLAVDSTPNGAQIALNGQLRGFTPAVFQLDPGNYLVSLQRTGCQPFSTSVTLHAGESRRISATLVCATTPTPPTTPQQSPVAQIAAQGQAIGPNDPRFALLSAQFYASLGMDAQAVGARLQAAAAAAGQSLLPQPTPGGFTFNIFPEYEGVDLNQEILQQGKTLLLGTITFTTNGSLGGVSVPAGTYGLAVMDAGTAAAMGLETVGGTPHGGFVIVIISFSGTIFGFIFFPVFVVFPIFFPIFSPIFVFQIFFQFVFVIPFPFLFPFPFFPFPFFPTPLVACPPLPTITPFSVLIGAPIDTLLATPAFTVTELGFSGSGGVLIRVQSLGPALSVQAAGTFSSQFVTVFPGGNITFNVISPSFIMRIDGGGITGCVSATRSGVTLSGQSSHN